MTPACNARRLGTDQMHCAKCHLLWDCNDPEPPACRTMEVVVATRDAQESLANAVGYVSALAPDPWAARR